MCKVPLLFNLQVVILSAKLQCQQSFETMLAQV